MSNDVMMHLNVTAHSRMSAVIEVHNIPEPIDWVLMNNNELQHTPLTSINTPGTYHYDKNTNSVFIYPLNTSLGISITVCMY